jgi:glucosamine-6-phosphate deaminase
MHISIHPTEKAMAAAVARLIAARLAVKPDLVLGLATGRTPVPLYRELAARFASGDVDFSRVTTFNLDEFVGVPPDHPGSYRQFMQKHLFGCINIVPGRIHFLNGQAANVEAECARYEAAIREAGGIDLQVLGIGTNGHIGFNEPARELHAWSHRVTLHETTRRANASLFGGDREAVPREALSMGMATILAAGEIVLLATGKSKAPCVERVVNGRLTTRLPASFLQLHPRVELVLDEPAGSGLSSLRS